MALILNILECQFNLQEAKWEWERSKWFSGIDANGRMRMEWVINDQPCAESGERVDESHESNWHAVKMCILAEREENV